MVCMIWVELALLILLIFSKNPSFAFAVASEIFCWKSLGTNSNCLQWVRYWRWLDILAVSLLQDLIDLNNFFFFSLELKTILLPVYGPGLNSIDGPVFIIKEVILNNAITNNNRINGWTK